MTKMLSLLTGSIAGLLYAACLFISWKGGINALAGFLSFYTWAPIIVLIIGGGAWWFISRNKLSPEFSLVLQYALLAYLVFELWYAASNFSLFGWLDKELNNQLVQHLLDSTKSRLQNGGAGKDQLRTIEELAESGRSPLTIRQTAIGLGQNLLMDFLKCLFIATITKQKFTRKE